MNTEPAAADKVFANPLGQINDFAFDDDGRRRIRRHGVAQRAAVRRDPAHARRARLAFVGEGSKVYDLGCSTGTTLTVLHKSPTVPAQLIGIDNSDRDAGAVPREARRA